MFEGQHEAARPTSAATKSPEGPRLLVSSGFPFLPFSLSVPAVAVALRRSTVSPHQTTSSRCESRPAAADMFSWILRGCRDECSASDQLKQVYLLPPESVFPIEFEKVRTGILRSFFVFLSAI